MKIQIGSRNRMETAVKTFGERARNHADYLLPWTAWREGDAIGQIKLMTNGQSEPMDTLQLNDRAVIQLSERLGAGNFLPHLDEWHKQESEPERKEVLEQLYITTIEKLRHVQDNPLLFRTEPGGIRAVLSNQYVVLNNYDLLLSTLEKVKEEAQKNEVPLDRVSFDFEASDDYADVRFYFINDATQFDKNYRGGIVVKNGECGGSAFDVQLILFNTACANVIRTQIHHTMTHRAERVFRYSEITNRMQAEVVYRKAAEMSAVLFKRSDLAGYYERLMKAKGEGLNVDRAQIVMGRSFSQQRKEIILDWWKVKEEQNVYGLAQAITNRAQELDFSGREVRRSSPANWCSPRG